MLELESVTKTYGRHVRAVDDLTLTVKPGEIFGFLGPNGAGKTTTIKMVVGLLSQDSGSIRVNGCDVAASPLAAKAQIGYVPDNPDLYDRLTGLEYLSFIADVFGLDAKTRRSRAAELLDMFELDRAVGDLIQSYSHGMKQKLALIAALIHDPALWILDEPLTGLDPRSARLFKDLMHQHCQRGNTVFFSTHVLDVAERLCDRVGIINRGKLIARGTVEELRGAPSESLEAIFLELTDDESDG